MEWRRSCLAVSAVLVAASVLGCGPPGGFLLTPVPADKRLAETVLERDRGWFVNDKILVLDAEGLLVNAETGPMFGRQENPVALFCEKLAKAANDPNVKAVVVRINSPGGTVAASDIMHRQLTDFRRQRPDVKVAAAIVDVGASGGYYVACGAERIYALPTSLTGSIGVLFQTFSIEGTLKMIGVRTRAIKSGKNKDLASPLRDLSDEQAKLLQAIIDEYYENFLAAVLAGRPKLTRAALAPLADGRVFTGTQAKKVGLVDELLYPEQVINRLKSEAGLAKAKVVIYGRPLLYKGTIYSKAAWAGPAAAPTVNLVNVDLADALRPRQPQFLYLWTAP